jgi:hypothetical protein
VQAAAQLEILERHISVVLRMLNERAELCRDLAEKHRVRGKPEAQVIWARAEEETRNREDAIRRMTEAEWIRPEALVAAE